MSGDWDPIDTETPQDAPSYPLVDESYPTSRILSLMMPGMSTYVSVVTSPATCTWPVVINVSTATRLVGSSLSIPSRMASLIWSAILSGCPSVTDSEVKSRRATCLPSLLGGKIRRSVAGAGDADHPEPARPSLLVFSQPNSN